VEERKVVNIPDSSVDTRNPEFAPLLQSLTVQTDRFKQAVVEKQRFLTRLRNQETISLEDRKTFMGLLKMEQALYHGLHDLQEKFVLMLREENQR
jgi:hypothetical protein